MSRAIVLVSCLLAAAGVAAYSYHWDHSASSPGQTPVYTVVVQERAPEPAAAPPQPAPLPPHKATVTAGDRTTIARELQRELRRVGCYNGEISGIWTTSSRLAMKSFVDAVNASLPIDNPDYVLLSLVQQRQETVCVTEAKALPPGEKSTATVAAALPAAAAAVGAFAATTPPAAAKADPKAGVGTDAGDDRPRTASAPPAETQPKSAQPDRAQRAGGPVPAEGVYERKQRRSKQAKSNPPKFVRNFLRALGFR